MPLISVIMASYNHVTYLPEAIESVLHQTFSDLELIIIDDASEDSSRTCIEKYSGQDNRIRTIFHDKNQGIAYTSNEGLNAAKGKYVSFLDSDDVWVPQKLQKQLDILKCDENLVVWSEGLIIDETSRPIGETFSQIHQATERLNSGYIFEDLLKGNHILASSIIFKRENLKGLYYNNQFRYLSDFQFNVDMARLYKFWFIPEPLVYYRIHQRSTVRNDYEGHILDYPKVGLYFLNKYGNDLQKTEVINIFCLTFRLLQSLLSQRKEIISSRDVQITAMDAQITAMDAQITTMDAHIQVLMSQVRSRDKNLELINSSITWQFVTKFQKKFIERILPSGTRRQRLYGVFIINARLLHNKGLKSFIKNL